MKNKKNKNKTLEVEKMKRDAGWGSYVKKDNMKSGESNPPIKEDNKEKYVLSKRNKSGDDKFLIWHVQGGLGKNVAATSLIPDLKKRYSDRKLVMVVSWPEVFFNHPSIDRLFHMGHTPHFYEDYIDGKDTIVFQHEAYNQTAHVHKSQHLINNWCDLMDLEYTGQTPKVVLNYAQQQLPMRWGRDKPTMVIHSNGGPLQHDRYPYNWCRDIPAEITQQVVNTFSQNYHIFHVCKKESPIIQNVERIDDPLSNMELFSILALSEKRLLIDSCLQHAAAAFQLKSTVLWIGTSPKVFGYEMHNNITAKEKKSANQQIASYMFDYQFDNNIYECPYLTIDEMFNINHIIRNI